jgi:hypothetical protein
VACFFIEHVRDRLPPDLVRKVAAALRPGGAVFIDQGAHRPAPDDIEVEVREVEVGSSTAGATASSSDETGTRFCDGTGTTRR